ncbi:MAG: hypothetical protein ACFFBH_16565 [Promethearchaeota archaeon]
MKKINKISLFIGILSILVITISSSTVVAIPVPPPEIPPPIGCAKTMNIGYGNLLYGYVWDTWENDGDVVAVWTETSGIFPTLTHRMSISFILDVKKVYTRVTIDFGLFILDNPYGGNAVWTIFYTNGISESHSVSSGTKTIYLYWLWVAWGFKVDHIYFYFGRTDGNMLGYIAEIDYIQFF